MNTGPTLSPPPQVVLVVEDELPMRRFLRAGLDGHGFFMVEAVTGEEALTQAAMRPPDLVLLDLMLPDMDGFEVTRRLREWTATPIIVLSARGHEDDKIRALDAGADDYVTKPFSMGELLARMRVALRHRAATGTTSEDGVVEVGALRIDRAQRIVTLDGAPVHLTPREYKLLAELARQPGRVFTHEHLLRAVWGPPYVTQHHYVRVYMAQLRHKLEREPSRPKMLLTEAGVGYRLMPPEDL